jgi:hypothetical protein
MNTGNGQIIKCEWEEPERWDMWMLLSGAYSERWSREDIEQVRQSTLYSFLEKCPCKLNVVGCPWCKGTGKIRSNLQRNIPFKYIKDRIRETDNVIIDSEGFSLKEPTCTA